jgi:hypothetical protein
MADSLKATGPRAAVGPSSANTTLSGGDPMKAYAEACTTMRHYSNASLSVRLASVVQGIAMLAGWAVAISQKAHLVVALLPVVGLLFTALLYRFHMGYFRATTFYHDMAAAMEEKFFEDGCRPFAAYNKKHDELFGSFTGRFLTLNAPFTLVGTIFLLAAIGSLVSLLTGR